jgi:hypothetical protein
MSAATDQSYKPPPGHFANPLPSTVKSQSAEAAKKKDEHVDIKWWLSEKYSDDMGTKIETTLNNIRMYQVGRFNQMGLSSRLYGNRGLQALFSAGKASSAMRLVKSGSLPPDRLQFNLTASALDTIHSKMVKNKPSPMFLTSGGTYKEQRKARHLTRFGEAVFHEGKVHQKTAEGFRFGEILGDAFMYVYEDPDTHRVAFENVPAQEVLVDEIEASHGNPRQIHRVKNVDRGMLIAMDCFDAKAKDKLREADQILGDSGTTPLQVGDTIELRESWHLPSGPKAKDGLHAISCSKGVVWCEDWNENWLPFAKMAWSKPLLGYYGTSAAQQIQGQQVEVNKLLWLESMSIHMMGTFKIAVPMGSNIVPEHLTNGIGTQIRFSGDKAPIYLTPEAFHAQVPALVDSVKASAFEQLGVSMLSAQSKKPEGLDSGSAIREYNYIETDRFYSKGADYEQYHLDIMDLAIRVTKRIYDRDGEYTVKHFGAEARYISEIDWGELDIDIDSYALQCFPVSSLPDEPSGRMQKVQEYVQAGWMTPSRGRRLLNYPDTEMDDARANAQEEYFFKIFSEMVDGTSRDPYDDFVPPDPLDNLDLGNEMCLQEYQLAKAGGLKETRLDLLRTWMEQVDALKVAAMPPVAPGGPGGVPQGQPAAPPTSDLMPQGSGGAPPGGPPSPQ